MPTNPSVNPLIRITDVPSDKWDLLSQKKVFFGHKSVGGNILSGIQALAQEHSTINLNLLKTYDPNDFEAPIFAGFTVGENRKPESKCDAFIQIMDNGLGNKADIAILKLCYVDVTANTSVEKVFSLYKNTFLDLQSRYPDTIFAAMTVPLESQNPGIDTKLKIFLGMDNIWEFQDNIRREEFNQLIRTDFESIPFFDIAMVESTYSDGRREFFQLNDKTYFSMVPAYTSDGGHLNKSGREFVAEQFLIFLADLI